MNTSLGLLEVTGLALAIKAADVMAKSANIALIAIDKTRGSGWMLITITGDVAAVASAITSGALLAQRENGLVAQRVIPRPADDLIGRLLAGAPKQMFTPAQIVTTSPNAGPPAPADDSRATPERNETESVTDIPAPVATRAEPDSPSEFRAPDGETGETASMVTPPDAATDVCNLCNDPACPRRKGEPRAACLHHDDRG